MPPRNTAVTVTGTYAASCKKVQVNLKLVAANDAHIMAGADFAVPLPDVVGLIPQARAPQPGVMVGAPDYDRPR